MAKRREPRVELQLPIRVFGTDSNGKAFSENLVTVDVSRRGAKLTNIQAQLRVGETIGMTYGQTKGRFVVRWVGALATPRAGQIGVEYLTTRFSRPLGAIHGDFGIPEKVFRSGVGTTACNDTD